MSKKMSKQIKPVAKVAIPRMTEDDKKADTLNYILNPNTGKYVKRNTTMGKKLVEAEKSGVEVPKTMTNTQCLILVVQTLRDIADLDDSVIKEALMTIQPELPRGFPSYWGGKHKEGRPADHPKGPSNAYIFYTKAIRPSVKDANPGLSPKELVALMAKMWKETANEDRVEYDEQAAADKKRYESEMKVFEAEHPEQARAKSSPGKPTKTTAYTIFCQSNREWAEEENPHLGPKDITKFLAEKWDEVKKKHPNEIDRYQKVADKANEDFEERIKEFHSSPGSVKALSKVEQIKADDPEHYELNIETGRYVLKEGWKRNVDGTFTKKETTKESTKIVPKVPKVVPIVKTGPKSTKNVKVTRTAKEDAKKKISEIVVEEGEDDELLNC